MPAMKTYREAIFSGWFGPMGVGAVFLAQIAKEELEEIYEGSPEPVTVHLIQPVVLFMVLSSTLVHGTTIPLFKIGKRIRTRTLSITSTGSGQVLRLPKLQFGQQVNIKRTEEEQQQYDEAMSQLKRNTLMNTIQHDPHAQQQQQQHAINMHDADNDDEFNEEDFLPDESDETEIGYDESAKSTSNTPVKQHQLHIPSAATQESQSIRFLEPVNPRNGSGHLGATNMDKNEASVSSFRSWMSKNKEHKEGTGHEEHGIVTLTPPAATGSGGLRNLFRRHHKDIAGNDIEEGHMAGTPPIQVTSPEEEKDPAAADAAPARRKQDHATTIDVLKNMFANFHSTETTGEEVIDLGPEKLSPRIEVWDEPHHVVIEDNCDASSQTVIDKSETNWQLKVKDRIKELQHNIDNEVDEKH